MKKENKEITLGTLYDFNKRLILKQKKLTNKKIESIKKELEEWFNWQIDGYALLLCRERYDFTIFHLYEKLNRNPPAVAAAELIEVLNNRGQILSIEKDSNNDKVWEIWIKIGQEAFAYYLFNCDDFVVQC